MVISRLEMPRHLVCLLSLINERLGMILKAVSIICKCCASAMKTDPAACTSRQLTSWLKQSVLNPFFSCSFSQAVTVSVEIAYTFAFYVGNIGIDLNSGCSLEYCVDTTCPPSVTSPPAHTNPSVSLFLARRMSRSRRPSMSVSM